MTEPALKYESNSIFKQNYNQKLFISFKMAFSCCFGLQGISRFFRFQHKKFYNINY